MATFTGAVVPGGYSAVSAAAAEIDKKGDTSVPGRPILDGWETWIPPTPETYHADQLPVYEIIGTDAQIVQFPLRPGRALQCFSGALCYMSPGMRMEAKLAGLSKAFGRLVGGGSLFQLTYTNETGQDGYISCAPDYPGVIVPIHMKECPSGRIIAQRDSFLCATFGLGDIVADVSGGFNPASSSVTGMCCSGVDFIVQTISNGDWSFLVAMGTVLQKTLSAGETVLVDTDCILCFESSVAIDVKPVGGCLTACCGGQGLFTTTMTGPGMIWLQSMSIDKLRRLFPPQIQSSSGGGDGGGGS